jgi:hypothetical protein
MLRILSYHIEPWAEAAMWRGLAVAIPKICRKYQIRVVYIHDNTSKIVNT